MIEKLDMLRKLGELVQTHGIKLSQNYNLNSNLEMMQREFELHRGIRSKQNSLNWMASVMMNCIYGIEMMNEKYNPFNLKLRKWSEEINSNMPSYIDVLGEIYEKYNKPGKRVEPEIKLILMITGSAIKFHLTNVAMGQLSQHLGGMAGGLPQQPNMPQQPDIQTEGFEDDPNLMEKLRQQASAERYRKMEEKKAEELRKKMTSEHERASQRVSDLEMINRKRQEHFEQQQQLNALHGQLNNLHMQNGIPPNPLQNMTAEQHEMFRRQQIEEQKKQLQLQEIMKLQKLREEMLKNQQILNTHKINNDDSSISVDTDDLTNNSRIMLKRRKKKKAGIKVDTSSAG